MYIDDLLSKVSLLTLIKGFSLWQPVMTLPMERTAPLSVGRVEARLPVTRRPDCVQRAASQSLWANFVWVSHVCE